MSDIARLTDAAIRATKTHGILNAGDGLWLEVSGAGKAWRTRYTIKGKTRQHTLGYYPELKLADARALRLDISRNARRGVAPVCSGLLQAPIAPVEPARSSLEASARAWHSYMAKTKWKPAYASQVLQRLERWAFPTIGALPVDQVRRAQVIELLQACVTGAGEHQADHVRKHLVGFFEYLVLREDTDRNPAQGLARMFQPPKRRHQPAVLEIDRARDVLAQVETSSMATMLKLLHRFAALTGVRPSEAREAEWTEVQGDVWTIPAERMKGRRGREEPHTVYLAPQAMELLTVARMLARGKDRYLFPTDCRVREMPFSRSTLSFALKRTLGNRVHVPHGWRATMATILTARYPADRDLIQAMLAHTIKGAVAGRYDRTTLISYEKRVRELGREWADMLLADAPPALALSGRPDNSNVVQINRLAA